MHELLAVVIHLLNIEKLDNAVLDEHLSTGSNTKHPWCFLFFIISLDGDDENTIRHMLSRKYLEADCFILFAGLMRQANPWFEVVDVRNRKMFADGSFIADRRQVTFACFSKLSLLTLLFRLKRKL